MAAAQAPQDAAREAAIKCEFGKVYDGRRLRDPLQQLLVAYFAGRGEAVTELPLDYPLRGHEDFERRWLAKLRAALVADEGDQVDFLLWTKARSAPSRQRGRPGKSQCTL